MRVKTFSTHVVVKKCHVVRKMAGFTHGMSNIELDVCKKRFNIHASPGITFERQARAGTEDSAGPPHCVGPLFSGANAGSILRPRPGS